MFPGNPSGWHAARRNPSQSGSILFGWHQNQDLFWFFRQLHPCTKKQCLVNILRAIRGAVTLIKGNAFGPKLHMSRHKFWILIALGRQLLFMSFLGEKLKWEGKLNWKLAPDKAVILMLLLGLTKKLKLIVKGLCFANPGRRTRRDTRDKQLQLPRPLGHIWRALPVGVSITSALAKRRDWAGGTLQKVFEWIIKKGGGMSRLCLNFLIIGCHYKHRSNQILKQETIKKKRFENACKCSAPTS